MPKPSAENPGPARAKVDSPRMSRGRLWLFRLAASVLAPSLFFLATELVLRLCGYGYDPNFFLKQDIGGESFFVQNEDFSRRFFPPETRRQPDALRMRAKKLPGSVRIFVLGESAAMGDPEPAFGPARYLEVLLQQRYPAVQFELVNVAFTAINSHVLLPLAHECARHDGDLWIIYMGNNEMVGPFGAATILGAQSPPRCFVRLALAAQRTRTGQLVMALARRIKNPAQPSGSWGGMAMFQEQRVAPKSPKREAVYENFRGNLNDIAQCGLNSGAGIILNAVAVNQRDSPPFASLLDEAIAPADRARFDELFQAALKAAFAGDWTNAVALFGRTLEIDPGFAEAHFRLAVCCEASGRPDEARTHYQLACDTDALPFRTDSRENTLIRAAAARHTNDRVLFLDAPAELAVGSPVGLCGQETFYEHVHFNFDGGYRLGLAWAKAVERLLPKLARSQSATGWASQAICERRLGLTDWNRKLVLQSVMQRFLNPPLNAQFINAERLRRISADERSLLSNATQETVVDARRVFAEALAACPDDHHVIESYAVFLQSLGDLSAAIQQWRKVGELLPHDFLPWFQIGSLLSKQGNFKESETYLRKALARRPGLVEGWSELAQCLGARDEWLPSLHAFERASAMRPKDPVLWAFRAKMLGNLERRSESIECYRKAIELNPSYWEAHGALGDQYSMAGRIPEAISEYEAALKLKPDYAMMDLNLGLMFARQGRREEAMRKFEETLKLEPDNPVARDYLRQLQSRSGRQ